MTGLREKKKATTRESLLNAAEQLFSERGFADTTVDQIAEAAQVSKVTFYGYFKAKEDLLSDLHGRVLERALAFINEPEQKKLGAIASMKILTRDMGLWTEQNAELFKVLLAQKTVPFSCTSAESQQNSCPGIAAMVSILQRGIDAGELRADINAEQVGRYMAFMMFSEKLDWIQTGTKDSLVARLQSCLEILVSGIGAR